MSCSFIPLDKSPGLIQIGIGEVLRRIIGKCVFIVVKPDIVKVTAYDQLFSGLEAGCQVCCSCSFRHLLIMELRPSG